MKTIKLTILLLTLPLTFYAQSLTGLWAGTLTNDTNTVRKDQSFEIVLTQYKDKVYGYSRMTFFVNDSLYYIVKRVKGTVEGDVCEVKDDDILSHNFPHKPDKGVRLITTFRRNQQDSIWRLDGDWKTTETKRRNGYYSISGKIALKTETDIEKSKLIPHLEELKLTDDVAFYQESKKAEQESIAAAKQLSERNKSDVAVQRKPAVANETIRKDEVAKTAPVKSTPVVEAKSIVREENKPPVTTTAVVSQTTPREEVAKTTPAKSTPVVETKQPVTTTTTTSEVTKREDVAKIPVKPSTVTETKPITSNSNTEIKKDAIAKTPAKSETIAETKQPVREEPKTTVKTTPQKNEPVATTKSAEPTKEPVSLFANEKPQTVTNVPVPKSAVQAATFVAERKLAAPQTVFFKADSLELTLYDNGEVDGDTVSVLLNGELILAKQGLKTTAIRKTIYVPSGKADSLNLVLYAENLGKYPPNTGLLVVHDGDDVYQVRFSADLQQNATIIFRRKRN